MTTSSRLRPLSLAALPALLAGCLSMQSQSTLDAINDSTKNSPVVEAYVEYPGPGEKWAGPSSFVLHVVAKDAGLAQVSVAPALFEQLAGGALAKARKPASGRTPGMDGETARRHLAQLASQLQGGDEKFRGCLYPLRIRLVRASGALTEKLGCRGHTGWPRTASEMVNTFITAALGLEDTPTRAPAKANPPSKHEPVKPAGDGPEKKVAPAEPAKAAKHG
jgi:hypothetical protein